MPKSVWNRVVDSTPIDRTAKSVVSRGAHYDPEVINPLHTQVWFTDCPPIVPAIWPDFSGRQYGMLTVVGYGGGIGKHRRWICLCTCGRYVYRQIGRAHV